MLRVVHHCQRFRSAPERERTNAGAPPRSTERLLRINALICRELPRSPCSRRCRLGRSGTAVCPCAGRCFRPVSRNGGLGLTTICLAGPELYANATDYYVGEILHLTSVFFKDHAGLWRRI